MNDPAWGSHAWDGDEGWEEGTKHPFKMARGQGCSWGPSQEGSKPKVRAANVPGMPSTGALEEQKGCWGDEEEEAGGQGVPVDLPGMEQGKLWRRQRAFQSLVPGTGGTGTRRSWH